MRSSSAPTTNITPAPSSSPNGSEFCSNTSRNSGSIDATASATRNPMNIAAPPSVGVGRLCTRRGASEGCTTAPNRTARMRTTGVASSVVASATARTIAYPPVKAWSAFGVRRELGAQPVRRFAHLVGNALVVDRTQHPPDHRGDLAHLVGTHSGRGARGGTEAQATRDERLLGVVGDLVLVARDPGPVERFLRDLSGDAESPEIDEHQMIVGSSRHDAEPLGRQCDRQRLRV